MRLLNRGAQATVKVKRSKVVVGIWGTRVESWGEGQKYLGRGDVKHQPLGHRTQLEQ